MLYIKMPCAHNHAGSCRLIYISLRGYKNMLFDKNQKEFPTKMHYNIWFVGTQIMPLEITLLNETKDNLPAYMAKSCEQMQKFFLHLLSDMYENIDLYSPLPEWKYNVSIKMIRPFIDFCLIGESTEDSLIINRFTFDKFIKKLNNSIHYKEDKKLKISIEQRLKLYERCGLFIEYIDNEVIFTNKL